MATPAAPTRSAEAQAEHEAKLTALADAYSRLSKRQQAHCIHSVTGDHRADTLVFVGAADGSVWAEGVVVAGERGEDGTWLLDAEFSLFSVDVLPEGEIIRVAGWSCDVEVL